MSVGESRGLRPLRSLWLVDALYRNGAVLLSIEIARRCAYQGARLVVLGRLPAGREVVVPPEVDLVALERAPRRFHRFAVLATLRLARLARRSDVVVNCSEVGMGLLVSSIAARLARRPLVVAVHADLDDAVTEWVPRRLRPLFYWLHRHVDGAICVAPALVEPLVRNGLDPARIRVVRNGIDTTAVRTRAAAVDGVPDTSLPVLVATGRVAHQKAYDVLLRAHARVVADLPHQLHVHNDGPDLAEVRTLVSDLGVQDSVHFFDATADPLPAVARAAAFVLPSRHEGLPLSLLEAVSLGVPCIATDSSEGVRAALDDGRVGRIVPVDDVDALADALHAHLADPGPLQAQAALGPAHARAFDVEAMTQAWTRALGELAAR